MTTQMDQLETIKHRNKHEKHKENKQFCVIHLLLYNILGV